MGYPSSLGYAGVMDPLLHLTLTLSRLSRRRWTRTQALVALCCLIGALVIGLVEWLGYWPDWMRAHSARRGPLRL